MCVVIYLMQEAYTQFVLTIARYTIVYTVGRTFAGVLLGISPLVTVKPL